MEKVIMTSIGKWLLPLFGCHVTIPFYQTLSSVLQTDWFFLLVGLTELFLNTRNLKSNKESFDKMNAAFS